jgi:phosphoadenosine phosphosulfate reductase
MERSVAELVGDADVEALTAGDVIDTALERLHPSLALACSFQKEESVLIDMLLEREPRARIFTLDTHVLFPETYELWHELERRYGIRIEVYQGPSLGRQAAAHGDALWARNPDLCCSIRKLAPLAEALSGLDGWITGVRRDQAASRTVTPKLGWDERHELWKVSPLADWTDDDVWTYVREHELPVNPLHRQGYASIGCTHCTAPGAGRDGRWAGMDKTECGLHA